MDINMNEFIKKNEETFEKYEKSGIAHDFVPYAAIKYAADRVGDVEVAPVDESGVNYIVRWNGKEVIIGFLNRSDMDNEAYAIVRICEAIKRIAIA